MYILFILSTSLISENDTAGDPFVVIVRAGDERMWGGDPCGRPGVRQLYQDGLLTLAGLNT